MTDPRDTDPLMPPDDPPRPIRRDPRRALAWLVLGLFAGIVILALLVAPPGAGGAQSSGTGGERTGPPASGSSVRHDPPVPLTLAAPSPVLDDDGGGIAGLPPTDTLRTGIATWYRDPRKSGLYAAVPGWHWGDTPYRLRVCGGRGCVTVTVSDACGCPGGRIIDLSPLAFSRLAPLSKGVLRVTVTDARGGPLPTLPATDTAGQLQ